MFISQWQKYRFDEGMVLKLEVAYIFVKILGFVFYTLRKLNKKINTKLPLG